MANLMQVPADPDPKHWLHTVETKIHNCRFRSQPNTVHIFLSQIKSSSTFTEGFNKLTKKSWGDIIMKEADVGQEGWGRVAVVGIIYY
jgi:hypothetical protein